MWSDDGAVRKVASSLLKKTLPLKAELESASNAFLNHSGGNRPTYDDHDHRSKTLMIFPYLKRRANLV